MSKQRSPSEGSEAYGTGSTTSAVEQHHMDDDEDGPPGQPLRKGILRTVGKKQVVNRKVVFNRTENVYVHNATSQPPQGSMEVEYFSNTGSSGGPPPPGSGAVGIQLQPYLAELVQHTRSLQQQHQNYLDSVRAQALQEHTEHAQSLASVVLAVPTSLAMYGVLGPLRILGILPLPSSLARSIPKVSCMSMM